MISLYGTRCPTLRFDSSSTPRYNVSDLFRNVFNLSVPNTRFPNLVLTFIYTCVAQIVSFDLLSLSIKKKVANRNDNTLFVCKTNDTGCLFFRTYYLACLVGCLSFSFEISVNITTSDEVYISRNVSVTIFTSSYITVYDIIVCYFTLSFKMFLISNTLYNNNPVKTNFVFKLF